MRNKSIVMLGDDTWSACYPDAFTRAYPFPSFDVKDLHSVDDGVLAHVWPELAKVALPPDWVPLPASPKGPL